MDRYFLTSFWWSLSILLCYRIEIFPCLLNLVAISVLIEDALKPSFGGKLTIFITHQVKQLLNGRGHLWMSDQITLRYQVVLMENPGLTISPCEVLNPTTLLPTPNSSFPFHSCLETLDHWTKSWEGLSEDPLTNTEEIWYTDGSSFVLDGKRRAEYAIVSNFETIEPKPLPPGQSVSQFSCSVVYDSLQPHESQHARPPCPSPTPGVYSNSCPLSQRCHPAISSSVIPFSSCPQFLSVSGSFPVSQLFASGGQRIGVSASASVLPMNTQDWSALGWTGWFFLQSKGLSRVFSNNTVQKHQFFSAQLSL